MGGSGTYPLGIGGPEIRVRGELWLAAPLSFLAASLQKEAMAAMLKSETKTAHEVKELMTIC